MDRRQMSAGPHLMRPNSFIPTSSSTNNQHSGSSGGNTGKLGQIQIQQLALQSQLQAQSHGGHVQASAGLHPTMNNNPHQYHHHNQQHQQPHHNQQQQQFNSYYQSVGGGANQNQFSHGTIPRHLSVPDTSSQNHQLQPPPPPPPTNSRTLRKAYSSHYGTTLNPPHQQPHHVNGNGNNPLYGNLMGGANGRPLVTNGQQHHDPLPPLLQQQPPQPIQIQPVINQIQQQHHSHKILQHYPSAVGDGDGLPPTLVESMRTLFDILDDSKQGRVRLSDIESRWENNDGNGSPKGNTGAEPLIKMGVMGYLRKVTPPDGMLTFDRFCSGLRLALVTNNNSTGSSALLHQTYGNHNIIPQQQQQQQQQQQSLHVKNVSSNNLYANNNPSAIIPSSQIHILPTQRPTSLPISTNHNVNQAGLPHSAGQSRIPNTSSRIPGFSSNPSKLSNGSNGSGIPVSPKNKFSSNLPYSHQNGPTAMSTARRIPLIQSQQQHSEQGTTVALIHQPPPPPNPKPHGNAIPAFSHRPHDIQIGTIRLTKPALVTPPNGGFTKITRYSSKNGSLDNLKSDSEEMVGKPNGGGGKVRPPSAPILDTTDDDDGGEYYANRSSAKRERARSRDRDMEDTKRSGTNPRQGKTPGEELSFGKRVVSFVTPRQRTLSMPQLQLSKLKSKSIQLDEDSSPSASSSSHSPLSSGDTKIGALKSSLKSTNHGGSAIPTKMIKQKSDVTILNGSNGGRIGPNGTPQSFKDSKDEASNSEKEQPPAPPKPPRNNSALTVTVHNGSSSTPDPPLSGSSTASINNPSKPEIRQYLQSWKKGVAEKRPVEGAHPPPPPLPQQPPPTNPQNDVTSIQEVQNGTNNE